MNSVLVPSDLSVNSNDALRYALHISAKLNTSLILFHCSHIPAGMLINAKTEEEQEKVISEDTLRKNTQLKKQLAEATEKENIKPADHKILVEFNPLVVENIIEAAEKNQAGLIVMGTHGASGLKKLIFGSNTSELISKSSVPVLAVPMDINYTPVKTIVFATDLEDFEHELELVFPFARGTGAELQVLYMDYGPHITNDLFTKAERIIQDKGYNNVRLISRPATIETPLISQINKELQALNPSWLVMFTKERSFWDKILHSSKTQKLSYSLNYPLLSFRKHRHK